MAELRMEFKFSLPWWKDIYLAGFYLFEFTIGGVDIGIAREFLLRHTKYYYSYKGRWVRF